MKQQLSSNFQVAVLCNILLAAAIPLALLLAIALSRPETAPEVSAAREAETEELSVQDEVAAPEEVTLRLAGALDGRGVFVFEGDTIAYRHESEADYPRGVTVDGRRWGDLTKPFELDYTPEFNRAVILEKQGPDTVRLTRGRGKFELAVDDSAGVWPYFQAVIATKNQIDRDAKPKQRAGLSTSPASLTKDFVTPPSIDMGEFLAKTTQPGGFPSAAAQNEPGSQVPGAGEITLTIEGKIYGGKFLFTGNAIVFDTNPRREPLWPEDITVDGKPWDDLSKPFELAYTPDYAKAVILEKEIDEPRGMRLHSNFPEREFVLWVEDSTSWGAKQKLATTPLRLYPFRVRLAVKNQLPHQEILWKNFAPSSQPQDRN